MSKFGEFEEKSLSNDKEAVRELYNQLSEGAKTKFCRIFKSVDDLTRDNIDRAYILCAQAIEKGY